MSSISLRLSESLHKGVREAAKKEGVSINQLINTALAEKLSALMTEEYLVERSKRGSRKKFERAIGKVKDIEPDEEDQI
ncbi:MAG: toxin-antitoxin system HicB family antitoxin [Candidatus Latescibacteria bacterium]|nr:toxin-antitoxin system HicB family antitoxin [Candidatus Latescibacterota bacterium]